MADGVRAGVRAQSPIRGMCPDPAKPQQPRPLFFCSRSLLAAALFVALLAKPLPPLSLWLDFYSFKSMDPPPLEDITANGNGNGASASSSIKFGFAKKATTSAPKRTDRTEHDGREFVLSIVGSEIER